MYPYTSMKVQLLGAHHVQLLGCLSCTNTGMDLIQQWVLNDACVTAKER